MHSLPRRCQVGEIHRPIPLRRVEKYSLMTDNGMRGHIRCFQIGDFFLGQLHRQRTDGIFQYAKNFVAPYPDFGAVMGCFWSSQANAICTRGNTLAFPGQFPRPAPQYIKSFGELQSAFGDLIGFGAQALLPENQLLRQSSRCEWAVRDHPDFFRATQR